MQKIIDMHCWVFDGAPISWNPTFFPIIIIDPEVSLKLFVNFKMTWLSLCSTKILLDSCGGGMRYFNRLVLRTILVILISLTFLEIIWRINTEEPTTTEEPFVWRGNISTYQRDLFPSNLTNWHPIRMGLISYICC